MIKTYHGKGIFSPIFEGANTKTYFCHFVFGVQGLYKLTYLARKSTMLLVFIRNDGDFPWLHHFIWTLGIHSYFFGKAHPEHFHPYPEILGHVEFNFHTFFRLIGGASMFESRWLWASATRQVGGTSQSGGGGGEGWMEFLRRNKVRPWESEKTPNDIFQPSWICFFVCNDAAFISLFKPGNPK